MTGNPQSETHGVRNVAIVVIAVLVIIIVLLVPVIPFTYTVETTTVTTQTNTVPTYQIVTVIVPVQTAQSQNQALLDVSSYTLQPNNYVYGSGQVPAGSDVAITWSADDTVNVYAFTSSQFSAYSKDVTGASPIVQQNAASGTLGFHAYTSDTYYIVIVNSHNGIIFGIGSKTVGIFSASAIATWQQTVTVPMTQTQTVATSTTTIQTVTNTQPVQKETMISLLDWLLGIHP